METNQRSLRSRQPVPLQPDEFIYYNDGDELEESHKSQSIQEEVSEEKSNNDQIKEIVFPEEKEIPKTSFVTTLNSNFGEQIGNIYKNKSIKNIQNGLEYNQFLIRKLNTCLSEENRRQLMNELETNLSHLSDSARFSVRFGNVSHDMKINKAKTEKGIEYSKTLHETTLQEQLTDQWVEQKLEEFNRRGIGKRKSFKAVKCTDSKVNGTKIEIYK